MLRPYQRECLSAVADNWRKGVLNQLIVLPTGSGKTVIAANLPDAIGETRRRCLVLTHLDTLVHQTAEAVARWNPGTPVSIEQGPSYASPDSRFVVASVQTLCREHRLARFVPEHFGIIFVDEAHHAAQSDGMYATVLRYFGALKGPGRRPDCLLVGLTATARRADGIGLELVFDKIVYHKQIGEMIAEGWLADIKAWSVETTVDLDPVTSSRSDFYVAPLSRTVNTEERNLLVVDTYIRYGEDKPAVAFTVDVDHSMCLAAAFRKRGIDARWVSGQMRQTEARRIIDEFANLKFPVLVSCMKVGEGFDAPAATVALMARPTKSQTLYIQQIGRVMRPWPSPEQAANWTGPRKEYAIIIDFVDNSSRHNLVTLPTLFGLKPRFRSRGARVSEINERAQQIKRRYPSLDLRQVTDIDTLRASVHSVDLLSPPEPSEVARRYSKLAWVQPEEQSHCLVLPDFTLIVRETLLGQWELWKAVYGAQHLLAVFPSPKGAFEMADQMVPDEAIGFMLNRARWRGQTPTLNQASALLKLDPSLRQRFRDEKDLYQWLVRQYDLGKAEYSRGGVSKWISQLIAKSRLSRSVATSSK